MNPLTYIQNMTTEDVQRLVRIGLQWLAAYLVTSGFIMPNATWVQPVIGVGVGVVSLAWTLYGNRLIAKLNDIAKSDQVAAVVVKDADVAAAAPSAKVDTK